jgi:recombination protein RecA
MSDQVKSKVANEPAKKTEYEGNTDHIVSTGSTLLDLAISGGRVHGGGIPSGILVEIFGPSGSGKTVLLSEIAGAIQRKSGDVMFHDPEARLNKQFAKMFDLDTNEIAYDTPDTVSQVFQSLRDWEVDNKKMNAVVADSLAALSTDWEMGGKDQYGMRRAKELSEQLRLSARILKQKNLLMVASNQVRVNQDAGPYGQKFKSPGGEAVGFYSSLRLRTLNPKKIKKTVKVSGKEVERVIGIEVQVEVFKNSVWSPYRKAPLYILFDYGIDDIRANLQFIKDYTKNKVYTINDETLSNSLSESIEKVEEDEREYELREEVIALWHTIENKFKQTRKKKKR